MYFTINDLLCFDDFKNMRLIAGAKGTQNRVSGCGILDYHIHSGARFYHRSSQRLIPLPAQPL